MTMTMTMTTRSTRSTRSPSPMSLPFPLLARRPLYTVIRDVALIDVPAGSS